MWHPSSICLFLCTRQPLFLDSLAAGTVAPWPFPSLFRCGGREDGNQHVGYKDLPVHHLRKKCLPTFQWGQEKRTGPCSTTPLKYIFPPFIPNILFKNSRDNILIIEAKLCRWKAHTGLGKLLSSKTTYEFPVQFFVSYYLPTRTALANSTLTSTLNEVEHTT